MVVNPPANNKGFARLTLNDVAGSSTLTATMGGDRHIDGSSFTVTLGRTNTGVTPTLGRILLAVVENTVDVAGNYVTATGGATLTAGVLAIADFGANPANGTVVTVGDAGFGGRSAAVLKGGTFRLVLVSGEAGTATNDLNAALRVADVGVGTLSHHLESDRNDARGATAQTASDQVTGVGGVRVVVANLELTAGNWRNKQAVTATATLLPANGGTALMANQKQFKLAFGTAADGSSPVKLQRLTPTASGDATTGSILVDTDFGQALGGTGHYTHVATGQELGDVATPAAEKSGIYAIGTTNAADNEQMEYVFSTLYSTTPDSSTASGFWGKVGGSPTQIDSPVAGFEKAIAFPDGPWIDCGRPALALTAYTIDARYRHDGNPTPSDGFVAGRMTAFGTPATSQMAILVTNAGQVKFVHCQTSAAVTTLNGPTLTVGASYDFRAVWSGTNLYFFVDGALVAGPVAIATVNTSASITNFAIGGEGNGVAFYALNGAVIEARFSSVARSTAAYTPSAVPYAADASTIGLWHMDHMLAAVSARHVRTTTATKAASAAIRPFKDAALTQPGVGCFSSSAYDTAQDLFRRPAPSDTAHSIAYLEAYLADAYGVALASLVDGFTASIVTEDGDEVVEGGPTTVSTDAAGRVRWSHAISDQDAAFNRFPILDGVRVAGSHVVEGPDDPNYPPAIFSAIGVAADILFGAGPFPAYPKTVRVAGAGFSGGKEPSADAASVFGVNSEVILEGIFTAVTEQRTVDPATYEPTGRAIRTQNLPLPMRFKDSSRINEATFEIQAPGRHHPRDVAGRPFVVTAAADRMRGRYAAFNRKDNMLHLAPTDEPASTYHLQSSLGYAPGDGVDNGFATLESSLEPATVVVYYARSADALQIDSFDLLDTSLEVAGFYDDKSNFGYVAQSIAFTLIVDPYKVGMLTFDTLGAHAGVPVRALLHLERLLPGSLARVNGIKPDTPPRIFVCKDNGPGLPMTYIVDGEAMLPIDPDPLDKSPDWELTLEDLENGSYVAAVQAIFDGTPLSSMPQASLVVGVTDPGIVIMPQSGSSVGRGHHMVAGKPFTAGFTVKDTDDHTLVVPDADGRSVSLIRAGPLDSADAGYGQYLDSDHVWKRFTLAATAYAWAAFETIPGVSNLFVRTWTGEQTASWGDQDIIVVAHCKVGAVPYSSATEREIVGALSPHDAAPAAGSIPETAIGFDPVPVSAGGTGHEHTGSVASGGDGSAPIARGRRMG